MPYQHIHRAANLVSLHAQVLTINQTLQVIYANQSMMRFLGDVNYLSVVLITTHHALQIPPEAKTGVDLTTRWATTACAIITVAK